MKNEEYWTKRKANLIYEQMDKAEKQADKFDKVYKESKAYLDKQINKIFDKFQRDYGLSERDARHVLKNMKDQKDLNELRKVLEARPNDPNIQRLLADLDSPAYAYRMKRLERLNDDLDRMRESIYHSEKKGSDAFYSDLMKDSYYKATFDLQQQTGLAYSFSDLPETEIKRLQGLKWTGEAYSDRIWSNTGALASSVKDELLVSLMTGRSVRDTSQAIAERFDVGQNKARRLVRTESAFFHNQMELLSYEDAEITKYKFVAVLDKRTSHICQQHDNKVYNTDEAVPGVNYPPLHPWCRSTTIAHDDDINYSKLERRARNPETGKVEYVPADMSYKEWYSKYVDGNKESIKQRKAFDKTIKNGIIDSEVDKWTKCLVRLSDKKIIDTEISQYIPQKHELKDWNFDFYSDYKSGDTVKALKIAGGNEIEALISYHRDPSVSAVYISHIERKPGRKMYEGITAHMFAEAVAESFDAGYDGVVFFDTKNEKLNKHYARTLGAVNISKFRMAIFEKEAKKLHDYYNFKRNKK